MEVVPFTLEMVALIVDLTIVFDLYKRVPTLLVCHGFMEGCYGYGLLMVVLLYENTLGLIWGYHYVNFSVFTYVSDRFSRFWACVQYRRSQWLMKALPKDFRLVYCTGDCVLYMKMPLVDGRCTLHSVLYMETPHRSYLYIR